MPTQEATRAEYESLAEGAGVIPPKFRNKGYEKLDFAPGEGGLGDVSGSGRGGAKESATLDAFLAGVSAGADPKELARELRGPAAPKRGRR